MRILTAILTLTLVSSLTNAAVFTIDKDHSSANFTIRHLVSKVNGSFSDVTGTIDYNEKDPTKSTVNTVIKADTIDTHVEKRNSHLKSGDFFDVQKYPEITFKSTKVTKAGKDKYKVDGLLNMHGVEKPVTLDAEYLGTTKDPMGNTRAGFSAKGKINRKDFGLTWNKAVEAGGMMLGDDVTLDLEVEAVQKK